MPIKPLSDVVSAKQQAESDLLKRQGVTGVDVGYKYVDGELTDEIAIRVMVEKKKKSVPADQKVPGTIDGVKTDVIERTFFLHASRNQKPVEELDLETDNGTYNPLRGGVSIGPVRAVQGQVWAGTLGAVVRDNNTGNPLLLSNFHVLAVDQDGQPGDAVAQPSLVDGGRDPTSIVGALQRVALTGTVDAAVASLQGRGHSVEIIEIGTISGTATATPGMAVRKRGRTTGLTYGIVDGVSLSITLPYPGNVGSKTLTDQIDVRPDTVHNAEFADHGDSGAVLVNDEGKIVGLHFAGSNDGHGVANPIADVLSALDVSLWTDMAKPGVKDALDTKQIKEVDKPQKEKSEKFEIKEFEKLEFEGSTKFSEGSSQIGGVMAGNILDHKNPDKQPVDKPVKSDKEKVEFKEQKNEAKELKIEFKEHKNESKEHSKIEIKELSKDKFEIKEHKPEAKELKIETKEHTKVEIEKPLLDNQKQVFEGSGKISEGGDPFQVGQVANPGLQAASAGLKITDKFKDFIDKAHKDVDKVHKDFDKTHKDFDKTHKDKDIEKLVFEGGGKQIAEGGGKISEGGDPFQIGSQHLQAAGAAAAIKHIEKVMPDKNQMKNEGKIEIKDHKNENKEFKNEKIEGKDKLEIKDHKPELKDHKPELKELKGEKDGKVEQKEHGKIEIVENQKQIFEGGGKINEGGDPFRIGQVVNPGLQAAGASPSAHKVKETIKSEIEKFKPEKEFDKIKWEKEHIKEIEKIKPEKEFDKHWQLDKHKVEFEKIVPENPKQLVDGGPKLADGGDPFKQGGAGPQALQDASADAKKDEKKEGGGEPSSSGQGGGTQPAGSAGAAAKFPKFEFEKHDKFPKFEFEKHDKFPKVEFEKHPKLEIEKIKFEGEKIKFEKEKEIIFDKPKPEFEKILQEGPKTIAEGGPGFPNQPDPVSRIAQLEAAVAQLSTFIPQHLRPDLGAGALTNEPDHKPGQKAEANSEQKAETKSEKAESKPESKPDPKNKKS
jgi:hypothetical protein